jgi:hypothetical protein
MAGVLLPSASRPRAQVDASGRWSGRDAQVCFDVLHEQVEVELIDGRGLEAQFAIEGLGGLILGVGQYGAAADNIGGLGGAQDGVFEQGGARALALFGAIDGQACQQDDRHGIIAEPFGDARRGILAAHGAGGERVVADDRLSLAVT